MITSEGGRAPRWRGDGRELFFLAPDGTLMAAGIDTRRGFRAAIPRPLFKSGLVSTANNHPYAVSKDGQRFLVPITNRPGDAAPITVVLNWPDLLRR